MGKVGCDIWEKRVSGWRKKEAQILSRLHVPHALNRRIPSKVGVSEDVHVGREPPDALVEEARADGFCERREGEETLLRQQLGSREEVRECDQWCAGVLITQRADLRPQKKKSNSEIWGKGVCDIWEKSVFGWRNKIPAPRKVRWIPDAIHTA